jgi:short-subunit dehydrogenase
MSTALITGATAGIGEAFTRLLAGKGFDLVLVARDEARLNERASALAEKYGVKTEILVADLSVDSGVKKVISRLTDSTRPVEVLINNAGFGLNQSFLKSDLTAETGLLDVLVKVPMQLSHSVLPQMVARNSGTIINVSSVAGWIAGGTYSAAKSYVTVFSEYLNTELKGTKVKVSALCPGFTHTEFHSRGKMKMDGLPNYLWLGADRVVSDSWKAAAAGKPLCVPGLQYKILSFVSRFGPRPLVRKQGMKVRRRQRPSEAR